VLQSRATDGLAVRRCDSENVAREFPAATFDLVFSSNVLEHVSEVLELLVESRRVLKRSGIAIHLMPTPSWRIWTSLTHYLYLTKRLFSPLRRSRQTRDAGLAAPSAALRNYRHIFLPAPHGVASSIRAEIVGFSRRRWPAGVFYTGYAILPRVNVKIRRTLARLAGSSCNVFLVRPRSDRVEEHRASPGDRGRSTRCRGSV
jgi:SAM-dependent methyltransferase